MKGQLQDYSFYVYNKLNFQIEMQDWLLKITGRQGQEVL